MAKAAMRARSEPGREQRGWTNTKMQNAKQSNRKDQKKKKKKKKTRN
jgi:hypothetical protein